MMLEVKGHNTEEEVCPIAVAVKGHTTEEEASQITVAVKGHGTEEEVSQMLLVASVLTLFASKRHSILYIRREKLLSF